METEHLLPLLTQVSEDEFTAELCRQSFYQFFLEFWETIEAVELVPNWHIEYLCNELQQVFDVWAAKRGQPDMLINVPPGTSKSTTVTQLFPAWLWLKQPATRIISSSYASSLSVSHAVKSRDCLRSDKFQRLFPGLIEAKDDEDGKTAYRNTRGGQRYTTSSGGTVTGVHADFIILDDPLNPAESGSDAALAAAETHLKTLSTRKTDKARSVTILVMQRIHEKDPAGIWLASGRALRHICLPGELKADAHGVLGPQVRPEWLRSQYVDNLLDTQRLSRPVLQGLALALGSYGYAGQVQQLPAPEEGGLLKKAWFRTMSYEAFQAIVGRGGVVWNFDADTAYTADQKNDPSALVASCYLGQTLYVRLAAEMWLELPDLKKRLPELLNAHGYTRLSKLYVEPKACFVAGTLVRTRTGLVPIELVRVGDYALSFNTANKKQEYKKVLQSFTHNMTLHSKELITFILYNGHTITCTVNHEFYFEGDWVSASIIAQRALGMGCRNERPLRGIQSRPFGYNRLERRQSIGVDEASARRERLLANDDKAGRQIQYGENTPGSGASVSAESRRVARGQSSEFCPRRQSGRKFRVDKPSRKQSPQNGCRPQQGLPKRHQAKEPNEGGSYVVSAANRRTGSRYTPKVQARRLYAKDACRRIRRDRGDNFKRSPTGVEAREISLLNIRAVHYGTKPVRVYDLCVADNHNYCITPANIIVHNSGKSVVQELRAISQLNVVEAPTPTGSKQERVNAASPFIEAGRVVLLDGAWNAALVAQASGFPTAAHDDMLDCLLQAIARNNTGPRRQSAQSSLIR